MQSSILAPVIALVLWTFVMWAWLYATPIPAIAKLKLVYDPHRPASEFLDKIPARARWKADNYNHLHEQPTIFYAVALSLALMGAGDAMNITLAWAYVGLRIAHSLVQALVNIVAIRFSLFTLSSLVLLALTVRAALIVFRI